MALPVGVGRATVTVDASLHSADSITVDVGVVSSGRVIWEDTGFDLSTWSDAVTDTAEATFELPFVDQDGFVDNDGNAVTMWAYRVRVTAIKGNDIRQFTRYLQVFTGQDEVDLDKVPAGSVTGPTGGPLIAPAPVVHSVGGKAGVVTSEEITEDCAKLLAWAEIKANSAVVTAAEGAGGTDITGLSIQVDSDGTPIVLKIDGYVSIIGPTGITYAVARIMEGTSEIQRTVVTSPTAGTHFVPLTKSARVFPTVGLHTYKVNFFKITATSIMAAGSDTTSNQTAFSLSASTAPIL